MYGGLVRTEFEDRLLLHLQTVIGSKLRRGESFPFTWQDDASVGDGRTTVWMHQGSSLVFKYHGSRRPKLNPLWVDALAFVANTPTGLYVVPEPAEPPTSTGSSTRAK